MKTWKLWVASLMGILVLGSIALTMALWNNVSSEWTIAAADAQYALDNSPLQHIDGHYLFTASGLQEVYTGTDVFHRKVIAFVFGPPLTVQTVRADNVLPENQVRRLALQHHIQPTSVSLGYVNPSTQPLFRGLTQNVVYEVYGRDSKNDPVYAYFDATTGALVTTIPNLD